jgi:glycosyltransferase involved in cell wall biosynthesis
MAPAVLVVARRVPPLIGGEEIQISRLCRVALTAGSTVDVWTLTASPKLPEGVRVHAWSPAATAMPLYLVWLLFSLSWWRVRHRAVRAVVVSTRISGDTALLARVRGALGVGLIVFLTGGLSEGSEFSLQRRKWVRRWIVRGATTMVAHAAPFLDEVVAAGFGGATQTIDVLVPDGGDELACSEPALATIGHPRLVWCGRNHPVKDLPRLSRLMDGALRQLGATSLLVVTDTEPAPAVSGATVHVGCPNPRVHMANADVLLLTSRFEGQGAVIGESASVGTPTVAYAVGGIPEVMGRLDGGEVVPADATDVAFADAVRRVWRRFEADGERAALRRRAHDVVVRAPALAWTLVLERAALSAAVKP